MVVICGCEKSQAVTKEFRKRGHEAYNCDKQDCSGGHPEWHLKMDIFEAIKLHKWDLGIFFPPCTHLAVSGAQFFPEKIKDGRQRAAVDFFMSIVNINIPMIAIENPVGIMSTIYRKPDQIIHPYYFGDTIPKKTCLWLKNLPLLLHFKCDDLFNKKTHADPIYYEYNSKKTKSGKSKYSIFGKLGKNKGDERSVLSPFFAKAMADQWG